jgi:membrane protein
MGWVTAMRVLDHLHRLDLRELPWWEVGAVRLLQFVQGTWHQASRDKVIIRASGLAYSSLLAAVPLVVVGFSMFSAFGAFDDVKQKVEELLFSQFLPTSQDEIALYLNQFADGASKLGLVGFLFLVLASILLLDNIESNFNDIWHVTTRRRLIAKITSYTSVLIFGALFIGASLTMSARIKTALYRGVPLDPGTLEKLSAWLFPLFLTILAFWLMYLVIPFTRVRLASALIGALVGGVFFELAKNLFANSIGRSVRYSTIYGSLAVIPIFLVWLYITWIIVLVGLEIGFTHQHFAALVRSSAVGGRDQGDRAVIGLQLFLHLARRFHNGKDPPTTDELSRRFLVSTGSADRHIDLLVAAGLARRVAFGSGLEGVVPARSLGQVRVREVIAAFLPRADEEFRQRPIELVSIDVMNEVRDAGLAAVGDTSVLDLVQRLDGGDGSAPASSP